MLLKEKQQTNHSAMLSSQCLNINKIIIYPSPQKENINVDEQKNVSTLPHFHGFAFLRS